jgi:GNAT superfamily N-acetyltransferase
MQYTTFFDDPKSLSITVTEGELVVGVANAECVSDAITLTFVGVRKTHQKRGIGGEMLERLIAEARRLIAKDIRSAASLRLLRKKFGAGTILGDFDPTKLPEQPALFFFAPSLDMLKVENDYELTAEWSLVG